MVIMQETTEWADSSNDANHIYVFKSKPAGRSAEAVAYVPRGKNQVIKFRTPLTLDLKGRTFKAVD